LYIYVMFSSSIIRRRRVSQGGRHDETDHFPVAFSGGVYGQRSGGNAPEREDRVRGFGGPVVKFTQMNDQFGVLVGGRGGWIINHRVSIGGGGYGLVNNVDARPSAPDSLISLGYGGLEIEIIGNSDQLLHYTFSTLLGAGGISLKGRDDRGQDTGEHDAFFIAEPTANVIVNVTTSFRIGIGAGYRFVVGTNTPGVADHKLSGVTGNLTFKFGKF
jgi:hypothetical protein